MKARCQEQGIPIIGENMRMVIGDGIFKIRFPTMTVQDFGNSVSVIDGFLTENEIKQTFQKIVVFNNKDIECPFKSDYRCQNNQAYLPSNDLKALLQSEALYEVNGSQPYKAQSLANRIKCLESGGDMYPPSFRLLLQCCVDMANSCYFINKANPANVSSRENLSDLFETWEAAVLDNPKNACDFMTKFLELRSQLGDLTRYI